MTAMKRALLIIGMICAICTVTNVAIAKTFDVSSAATIVVVKTFDVPTTNGKLIAPDEINKSVTIADDDSYGTYENPKNLGTGSPKAKPTKSHLTTDKAKATSMISWDPAGDPLEPIDV